jgi:hypothetical protein
VIRYEYVDSAIKDADIHPDFIFDRERNMAKDFIAGMKIRSDIQPCPICQTQRSEILFQKWGCGYVLCPKTWTVSLASLPDSKTLLDYYHQSEISRFRASREYQTVVSQKRRDLWESQIGWIEGRVSRHLGNKKYAVVDWGSKFVGWVEFLQTSGFVDTLYIQDPLPPINERMNFGGQADVVCLIDVLQRQTQPLGLLQKIAQNINPGGILIAACRAGSGFDVLALRENSESVFPLDHIFLPSPQGMQVLLEQAGFEVLELTTPGLMDMTYVQNAGPMIPRDQYFLRYIMEQGDELLFERMQGFLQRNNLSSHLRCVARRK